MDDGSAGRRTMPGGHAAIHLFGGPYVTIDGEAHQVPEGSKRLLAFVALRRCRVERRHAAGTLWPFGDDIRAAGNLRSSLWRLRTAGIDVMDCDKWSLRLADDVAVDALSVSAWADRLIRGRPSNEDLTALPARWEALDLLPGWYDDWAILERERLRQRVLHALEALSRLCTAQGRHAEAVEAALAAVSAEPLRESAQAVLIAAHLGEHNQIEAHRAFVAYRDLLARELGAPPSQELAALIRESMSAGRTVRLRPATASDRRILGVTVS
jgi:DNA-binding SARP family transcriptional activator